MNKTGQLQALVIVLAFVAIVAGIVSIEMRHSSNSITGFTTFASGSLSNMTTYSDGDLGNVSLFQNVTFYANYTDPDGVSISDANCIINFTDIGGNMTYDGSLTVYTFSRQFDIPGTYSYNISCSEPSYDQLNVTDSITPNYSSPVVTNVTLSSTSGNNYTNESLTVFWDSISPVGLSVVNITDWQLNGNSIAVLNAPLQGDSDSSFTEDYSTYENNGTVVGAIYDPSAGSDGNGAYVFSNADNDIINFSYGPQYNLSTFTLAAWININDTPSNQNTAFIYKGDLNNDYGDFSFGFFNSGYPLQFSIPDNCNIIGSSITPYTWTHVAVTFNSTGYARLWINGVPDAGGQCSSPPTITDSPIVVGGYYGIPYYFTGMINGVKIYNRALSQQEIQNLYNNQDYVLASQELVAGDNWTACITPNDGVQDGDTVCSNQITIITPPLPIPPIATDVAINSASGNNYTDEDIIASWNSSSPSELPVVNITDWQINGISIAVLNMPFEGGSNSTWTRDYSTYGNNGTVNGATWNSTGGYDGNGAYMFNGNSLINMSNPSLVVNGSFTVMAWVNAVDTGTYEIVSTRQPTDLGFDMMLESGTTIHSDIGDGNGWLTNGADASYSYSPNTWYHVAYVVTPTNYYIYVNGAQVGDGYLSGIPLLIDANHDIQIGAAGNFNGAFNGMIDNVLVFNRALSPQEIENIYSNQSNIMAFQELNAGDNWTACITPNDGIQDGNTTCSNQITVNLPPSPVVTYILLNSTSGNNYTTENLTVFWNSSSPSELPVVNITDWQLDGNSIAVLNAPFKGGSASTWTRDYSTYGNNGTVIGAIWNVTGGHDGQGAYSFSNPDHTYINFSYGDQYNMSSYTLSAWINMANTSNLPGDPNTNTGIFEKGPFDGSGSRDFLLGFHHGDYTLQFDASDCALDNGPQIVPGTWTYITAVVNNATQTAQIWVNGVLNSSIGCAPQPMNDYPVIIGGYYSIGYTFTGMMDDVQIYNRALSPQEIGDIYSNNNIMDSQELSVGDNWTACITPNDGVQDGNTACSNQVTINPPPLPIPPVVTNVTLNSTSGNNYTTENLTVFWNSSSPSELPVVNITDWQINGTSIAVLNMPFEGGSNSTWTRDYSTYGNNGFVDGAIWNSTSGYDGNGAYYFNGGTNIVANTSIPTVNGSYTVMLWAFVEDMGSDEMFSTRQPSDNGFDMEFQGGDNIHSDIGDGTPTWLDPGVNTPFSYDANTWYHVAYVVNPVNYTIYVDAVPVGNGSTSGTPLLMDANHIPQIGSMTGGDSFNGMIDNVLVFNRALSPQEIENIYSNQSNIMAFQELNAGDNWTACITPNDGIQDGDTVCSNNVTIQSQIINEATLNIFSDADIGIPVLLFRNATFYANYTDAESNASIDDAICTIDFGEGGITMVYNDSWGVYMSTSELDTPGPNSYNILCSAPGYEQLSESNEVTPLNIVNCGSCGSCTADATTSGTTLNVTGYLGTSGNCITIGNDSIAVECNGNTINSTSGSGDGIDTSQVWDHANVDDCIISGFSNGINFNMPVFTSNDTFIQNYEGIHLWGNESNTQITSSTFIGSADAAILMTMSNTILNNNVTIDNNLFDNNNYSIDSPANSPLFNNFVITNNTIYNSGNDAILSNTAGYGIIISSNLIINGTVGIEVPGPDTGGQIVNNNVGWMNGDCIIIISYINSTVENNTLGPCGLDIALNVDGHNVDGIDINGGSNGNSIKSNTISDSPYDIDVDGGTILNTIVNNNLVNVTNDGIYISGGTDATLVLNDTINGIPGISSPPSAGIFISDGAGSVSMINNVITTSTNGIQIGHSSGVLVVANNTFGNNSFDILSSSPFDFFMTVGRNSLLLRRIYEINNSNDLFLNDGIVSINTSVETNLRNLAPAANVSLVVSSCDEQLFTNSNFFTNVLQAEPGANSCTSCGNEQCSNNLMSFTTSHFSTIFVDNPLLIAAISPNATGNVQHLPTAFPTANDWPMFMHDLQHTGFDNQSYSLDLSNFAQIANFTTGSAIFSSPAVYDGVVYIGSDDHDLYALNATNLNQIASFTARNTIYSSPAVFDDIVYVGSFDGRLYELNATNLNQIANFTTGSAIFSSPAVSNGIVYVGSTNNYLYALNASNISMQIATFNAGNEITIVSPAVYNGVVYIGSWNETFYALNASNISMQIANFKTGGKITSSAAISDGIVYVASDDNYLYALNASNISMQIANFTGGIFSSPAVSNSIVYIGSTDKYIYELNATTLKQIAKFGTGDKIYSSPAVSDGIVYIGSNDNNTYALNASNISMQIANFTTGSWVESAPAVSDGIVYIGSNDNNTYALSFALLSPLQNVTLQRELIGQAGVNITFNATIVAPMPGPFTLQWFVNGVTQFIDSVLSGFTSSFNFLFTNSSIFNVTAVAGAGGPGQNFTFFVNTTCVDRDGDGFNESGGNCGPVDCNDNDSTIYPVASNGMFINASGVTFCPGTYSVSEPILVNSNNVVVKCDDTIIEGNSTALQNFFNSTNNDNITIENCIFQNLEMGIDFYKTNDSFIINNTFINVSHGLDIVESYNDLIENNKFVSSNPFSFPGSGNNMLIGNTVTNSTGIDSISMPGNGNVLENNFFTNISFGGLGNQTTIINNTIVYDPSASEAEIDGISGTAVIENNTFYFDSISYSVINNVGGSDGNVIVDNNVFNGPNPNCYSAANSISVSGPNDRVFNNFITGGPSYGISVSDNSPNMLFFNNTIINTCYGFRGGFNNSLIANNTLTNFSYSGIYLSGPGGVIVSGNIINSAKGNGVYTSGNNTAIYSNIISNASAGIRLNSGENTVANNTLISSTYGILIDQKGIGNNISMNDYADNTADIYSNAMFSPDSDCISSGNYGTGQNNLFLTEQNDSLSFLCDFINVINMADLYVNDSIAAVDSSAEPSMNETAFVSFVVPLCNESLLTNSNFFKNVSDAEHGAYSCTSCGDMQCTNNMMSFNTTHFSTIFAGFISNQPTVNSGTTGGGSNVVFNQPISSGGANVVFSTPAKQTTGGGIIQKPATNSGITQTYKNESVVQKPKSSSLWNLLLLRYILLGVLGLLFLILLLDKIKQEPYDVIETRRIILKAKNELAKNSGVATFLYNDAVRAYRLLSPKNKKKFEKALKKLKEELISK